MDVPSGSHSVWKKLLTGEKEYEFEFFPTKMTIGRLRILIRDSDVDMQSGIEELRSIFVNNANLPKVQNDIRKLFA